jgi:GNAT superfamily N-acetyltransferase
LSVEKANQSDLSDVLEWLEREYKEHGDGFWHNRNIITRALDDGDLWVIRDGSGAVAFQVGDYSADILNVRRDMQGRGFGTALFEASLSRAMRDEVNVLIGECYPRSSLSFWERCGFERYGDMGDGAAIHVRRILERRFDIPEGLPRTEVRIGFYPERAIYQNSVPPFVERLLSGGCREDGVVLLNERVIGWAGGVPACGELAVRIEVGGGQLCFCKAKYPEAAARGVRRDLEGVFYVDAIQSDMSADGAT